MKFLDLTLLRTACRMKCIRFAPIHASCYNTLVPYFRYSNPRKLLSSTSNNVLLSMKDTSETFMISSREEMLKTLQTPYEYDVLIVGGGATGCGAALDAALRGLSVVCLEQEDFSSGTSSRSTKLIWGGSRYLVQAFVSLLNINLFTTPKKTVKRFIGDINMVLSAHRERKFLLHTQPHLTYWLPIAVPINSWIQWPPPFNFPLAAIGPLGIYPLFFKLYDSLSGFTCPPSHIMTPARARRKFPQLLNNSIKYCPVFYEGMHDDARTNLAIAQSAAKEGATMLNHCSVIEFIFEDGKSNANGGQKVIGAVVRDEITKQQYRILSKSILICGGPFTDSVRKLENTESKNAVKGAAGIHIVIPSYYAPSAIGLVDMNTSDGRFLFFLPWQGHVLVGTTDHKCEPTMRPEPSESDIRWVLNEASKYLQPELRLRREDVLSAWSGIRPLAVDPYHVDDTDGGKTSSASRDHIISHNRDSGVVFIAGGKWTTYREMAEDAINKIIEVTPKIAKQAKASSNTLNYRLFGYQGYSEHLNISLIQEYFVSPHIATHLVGTYGGRARDVLTLELNEEMKKKENGLKTNGMLNRLVDGFPYLEIEVIYCVRYEWARHADDILARRTRLAFLNQEKAVYVIPRVIDLMGSELNWTAQQRMDEVDRAMEYMRHFGGPKENVDENKTSDPTSTTETIPSVRMSTLTDMITMFRVVDGDHDGYINGDELYLVGKLLKHPLSHEEWLDCLAFKATDDMKTTFLSQFKNDYKTYHQFIHQTQTAQSSTEVYKHNSMYNVDTKSVKISFMNFAIWWNSERCNPHLQELKSQKIASLN